MNILLVEPNFPFPSKSKNQANKVHKNFVPIGLLKLGALYKDKKDRVRLVRGQAGREMIGFVPDEILVTSLFTYWSNYVWESIGYYRDLFPKATIRIGGIYATLHSGKDKFDLLAKQFKVLVHKGIHKEAEEYLPDYSLLPKVDYHATHMMRGCIRKCKFCGTWKIEPEITCKTSKEIVDELNTVKKNTVVFYDNNILANPNIKDILKEFTVLKINNKPVAFESQSGFDGRLMEKDPQLATLLKEAGFSNLRIAWDNGLNDADSIKRQISLLTQAGFKSKDISVFMIYNFSQSYGAMLKKLNFCKELGVQITDCRYRPLDIDSDNYKPRLKTVNSVTDYYLHKEAGWTDKKVRDFRSQVRKHNIWVRYARDKGVKYDPRMERWSAINSIYKFFDLGRPPKLEIIERSEYLQVKVKQLRRVKHFCKTNDIRLSDLKSITLNKEIKDQLQVLFNSGSFNFLQSLLTAGEENRK